MTRPRTPLVDVHAHFVTDDYVAAAIAAGRRHPDGMPGWPTWDAEQNLRLMDSWGVGTAVLSVSSPGTHYCWTPAPGVSAQVASVDAASGDGSDDDSGGTDWRALTARNAGRLLPRLADFSHN